MTDSHTKAKEFLSLLTTAAPLELPRSVADTVAHQLFTLCGVERPEYIPTHVEDATTYQEVFATMRDKLFQEGGPDPVGLIQGMLQKAGFDAQAVRAKRAELAEVLNASKDVTTVRWREVLLGSAIGDSFGAGIEFFDGPWIQANVDGSRWVTKRGDPVLPFCLKNDPRWECEGQGQNYQPGMYTDDCEMTVGLMHAMMQVEASSLTADKMIDFWTAEYHRAKHTTLLSRVWARFGVGRNGHGGMADVYDGVSTVEDLRERNRHKEYVGNAPPMRALPLAFASDAVMMALHRANADSTHPHPKGRASSLLIALTGRFFMVQRSHPSSLITDVLAQFQKLTSEEHHRDMTDATIVPYLEAVDALPPPRDVTPMLTEEHLTVLCGPQPIWKGPHPRLVRGLNADAQRTAGCVLYLLKHHVGGRPLQTLLRSLYVGGDVDSLAALCLAMVGGREGLRIGEEGGEGLPLYMLQEVEGAEYLVDVADAFGKWVLGCR